MQPRQAAFNRIMVPLDGSFFSEQALPYAEALAGDGEITLVAVTSLPEAVKDLAGHVVATVDEIVARTASEALGGLKRAAGAWFGDSRRVHFTVVSGDPAEEIVRLARSTGTDAIVMASHGHGAIGRVAFGSVADRVARSSPAPVLIIRPSDAAEEITPVRLQRVIVPLDGSRLADHALAVAEKIAVQQSLPIVLIRAIDSAELLGPYVDARVLPADLIEAVETGARAALESRADGLTAQGVETSVEVWRGAPFGAISETARDGDIIVMASHGRAGFRRWLLGSVAEKLVRSGPVPVLIVPAPSTAPAPDEVQGLAVASA